MQALLIYILINTICTSSSSKKGEETKCKFCIVKCRRFIGDQLCKCIALSNEASHRRSVTYVISHQKVRSICPVRKDTEIHIIYPAMKDLPIVEHHSCNPFKLNFTSDLILKNKKSFLIMTDNLQHGINVRRDQNPSSHIHAGLQKQTEVKYQMLALDMARDIGKSINVKAKKINTFGRSKLFEIQQHI